MPFNIWDVVVVALIILMVIGAVKLYKRPRSCCSGRGGDGCSGGSSGGGSGGGSGDMRGTCGGGCFGCTGCAGCTVRRSGENASSPKN